MSRIPLAVQLYSVRRECAADLPGTLKAIAEMGYEGVEFAGYYDRSAAELRAMLDDLGLQVAGTHTGLDTLLGDELERTIEFNRVLSNEFLIVPGLPKERTDSKEAWLATAELFNELAAKVAPAGMAVGYHNHTTEFTPLGGEMPWDIFFGSTRDEVVMQVDSGNALHGNGDPVACVRNYPGRARTAHLKEYSTTDGQAVVGDGDMPWADFFDACETVGGTEWYIVEQETYAHPPIKCVELCLKALKDMGK